MTATTRHGFLPSYEEYFQNASTVDGAGTVLETDGFGHMLAEVGNSGSAGATVTFEGSFDQNTWYAVGYQQLDGQTAPARAIAALTPGASSHHVYQLLDRYPHMRARQSSSAAGCNVTVKFHGVSR